MLKTFSGRKASQNEYELTSFIGLLNHHGVHRYLEIGARHGDTFHEIMINLPEGSHGVAVDLPGGMWGKSSSVNSLRKAVDDLRKRGYKIDMILGDSADPDIVGQIKALGPFDVTLIDGDHRYDGVKKDWDNYSTMASLVALHDIVGAGQCEKVYGNEVEVPILWQELKAEHEHIEFTDNDSKMGIGVCILP